MNQRRLPKEGKDDTAGIDQKITIVIEKSPED